MWVLVVDDKIHQTFDEEPNLNGGFDIYEVGDVGEDIEGFYYDKFINKCIWGEVADNSDWLEMSIEHEANNRKYNDFSKRYNTLLHDFPVLLFFSKVSSYHSNMLVKNISKHHYENIINWLIPFGESEGRCDKNKVVCSSLFYKLYFGLYSGMGREDFLNNILELNREILDLCLFNFLLLTGDRIELEKMPSNWLRKELNFDLESIPDFYYSMYDNFPLWNKVKNVISHYQWNSVFWESPILMTSLYFGLERLFHDELTRLKLFSNVMSNSQIEEMKGIIGIQKEFPCYRR